MRLRVRTRLVCAHVPVQAIWENRHFHDPDDESTKKIFNGALTVMDSSGTTKTYEGRWISSNVFTCPKDGKTWHGEFDAEGALTGLGEAGTEDATVLDWTRTHREVWKVVDLRLRFCCVRVSMSSCDFVADLISYL